jgi:hypothetical protein
MPQHASSSTFKTIQSDIWIVHDEVDAGLRWLETSLEAAAFAIEVDQSVDGKLSIGHLTAALTPVDFTTGLRSAVDVSSIGATDPSVSIPINISRPTPSWSSITSPLSTPRVTGPRPGYATPNVSSPIDTPERHSNDGPYRGKRDDPATPAPLGSGSYARLRGKKDFQRLTKHFDVFAKTITKPKTGLGGDIFKGIKVCIPPEAGNISKQPERWKIVGQRHEWLFI